MFTKIVIAFFCSIYLITFFLVDRVNEQREIECFKFSDLAPRYFRTFIDNLFSFSIPSFPLIVDLITKVNAYKCFYKQL